LRAKDRTDFDFIDDRGFFGVTFFTRSTTRRLPYMRQRVKLTHA